MPPAGLPPAPKKPPPAISTQADPQQPMAHPVSLEDLLGERKVPSHYSDHNAVLKRLPHEEEFQGNGHLHLFFDRKTFREFPEVIKPERTEKEQDRRDYKLSNKAFFSGVRDS